MEITICEFCATLRPVVYCKADAARLCLSCDARVHSANALSGRHFRTLLCHSCGNRPAYVKCMNHEMFICRNCDRTLHGFSFQHQKRLLKTYMGCPSPNDFAVLWGFDMNLLDNFGDRDQFVTSSTSSADSGGHGSKCQSQYSPTKSTSGASSQPRTVSMNQQRDNNNILQQIIGLKRLQLNEQTLNPSMLRGKEQPEFLSTVFETSQKLEEDYEQGFRQFPDISNDLQAMDISQQGLKDEPCSSPFSQFEHWKSPVFDSQLWSLQELGFCKEFEGFEDIPDVDPTFRNFEDIFGADQDPLIPLQNKSEDERARSFEGGSESSSDTYTHLRGQNDAVSPLGQLQATAEIPKFFCRQLSLSKLSTIQGDTREGEAASLTVAAKEDGSSDGTQVYSPRFKDKKKTRMYEEKQTRYSPRATDLKKRAKDHFTRPNSHQTKSVSSSRSY